MAKKNQFQESLSKLHKLTPKSAQVFKICNYQCDVLIEKIKESRKRLNEAMSAFSFDSNYVIDLKFDISEIYSIVWQPMKDIKLLNQRIKK